MSRREAADLPLADPRDPVQPKGVPRPPLLPALTSLRYFIALHVGLYHFVRPFTRWGVFGSLFAAGYTGVSFFFLLSGFILTYTHAQEYESGKGDLRRFWMARFARIYPVYFLAQLLAGYVGWHLFQKKIHILAYLSDFLMVQSWSVRLVGFFNVPAWSLSCEAFFYLLFPFVFLWFRPKSMRSFVMAIVVWTLLAMAAPLYGLLHYPAAAMHEFTTNSAGSVELLRIRRLPLLALPEFMAGISLGWFYRRSGISQPTAIVLTWSGVALLLGVLLMSDHLPYVMLHNGLLIPLQCMVILGLTGTHWFSRMLARPWLLLLGEASYSFYLIHTIFLEWMAQHLPIGSTISNAIWRLALITGISVLLYIGVERPARRVILSWYRSRTERTPLGR